MKRKAPWQDALSCQGARLLCGYGADIADDRRLFVYRSRFFSTICVCSLCLLMLMSGGFSNILNRVADNLAFGDLKRLQNARFSATDSSRVTKSDVGLSLM